MTIDRTSFESLYQGQPRWEIGRPQAALLDVADQVTGSILDSGCSEPEEERPLLRQARPQGHWHRFPRADPYRKAEGHPTKFDCELLGDRTHWHSQSFPNFLTP